MKFHPFGSLFKCRLSSIMYQPWNPPFSIELCPCQLAAGNMTVWDCGDPVCPLLLIPNPPGVPDVGHQCLRIESRHPDVTLICIPPPSLPCTLSPSAFYIRCCCGVWMYNFPLLWAAANQQQQDFLFTAFVSKPRSAPTAVHVYFCALVTFVTMYIHEVGGYAAFVDVRPAYIRTWLPGPFTTTTALPLATCQMEKSDSAARWKNLWNYRNLWPTIGLAAFTLERVFQMLMQCIGKQSRHRGGSFEFSILSFLWSQVRLFQWVGGHKLCHTTPLLLDTAPVCHLDIEVLASVCFSQAKNYSNCWPSQIECLRITVNTSNI